MPLFLGQDKISQVIVSVENSDGVVNTNDATLTSGEQMLSGITAYSNGKKYTGTIATVNGPSPSISISNDGTITANVSNPKGYQSSATTKTATSQLNTKGATTITPSNLSQTAVGSGVYTTGDIVVSPVPTETKMITANGTYNPTSGKYFSSVTVDIPSETFNTQTKTVTPTESTQTVSPDNGYDGLSSVTVNPISSTYVGSGVARKSAATITPSESVQRIAANQYLTGVQTISAIPSGYVGSGVTRKSAATITPAESEQVISSGQYLEGTQTISAIPSNYVGSGVTTKGATTITPSTSIQTAVSAGTYVTGDIKVSAMTNGALNAPAVNASGLVTASVKTSGYLDTSKTSTLQLTTKGATTITPSTSVQTAIASGTYATGNITVSAMPTGALSTPTINESTGLVTSGVGTSGYIASSETSTLQLTTKTAETFIPTTTDQTIDAGQYLTGVQTIQGDANLLPENIASGVSIFGVTGTHQGGGTDTSDATATAADIINGKTAYINGGKVTGTLVVQNYYTGTATPESTTGEDGDLYFKVVR